MENDARPDIDPRVQAQDTAVDAWEIYKAKQRAAWMARMPELDGPDYHTGRDRKARPSYAVQIGSQIVEETVQVGQTDEPDDLEIPRFLAPDPLESVPDLLRTLAEPGEGVEAMQARLWALYLELTGKLMLNLASPEEIALHGRLHNHLHWIAPPLEGDA